MALRRRSSLSPVELQLVDHVSRGERLDLAPGKLIDKAAMVDWDESRTVHASVIRDILRGRLATGPDPHGVRLRGARLVGRLDLEGLSTNVNLELHDCFLPEGLLAWDARLAVLRLNRCRLERASGSALAADRLVAPLVVLTAATFIGHGACGAVGLLGARLDQLECDGAKLRNDTGPALCAEGLQVEQAVFLRAGFEATGAGEDGAVRLLGARISLLECDGAKLRNYSGPALFAEGLQVEQAVSLGAGFEATGAGKAGAVCLPGARIDGGLILSGARLLNLQDGAPALNARRLAVGGDILGNQGLTCHGEVRLNNADITGSILFEGARLTNPGGCALDADDATVGAVVNCGKGFHAQGEIRFSYAKIPKLCFEGAHLSNACRPALTCGHLEAHELVLLTAEPIEGVVDLRHARVDLLRDDPKTWPRRLRLDSLSYGALAETPSIKERLGWLARDRDGYRPQPYEQLAATYRAKGHDEYARTVLVESQNRRRRRREGWREGWRYWPGRAWGRLLWATVGYGYRPWLALIWLVVLVVLGSLAVKFLLPDADFVEGEGAPTPNAFLYTVDVLLPFIDLGYAKWMASGAAQTVTFLLVVAGWVLATAVIAAFAGVLRRGD
jgi:hypothetical protein